MVDVTETLPELESVVCEAPELICVDEVSTLEDVAVSLVED